MWGIYKYKLYLYKCEEYRNYIYKSVECVCYLFY